MCRKHSRRVHFVIAVLIAAILILTLTNTIQLVAPYGLSRLFSKRTRPKLVIGYACTEQLTCGGWADRQKGIVSAYILSSILGQEFRIHMPVPCDVNLFLEPNHINWRLQDGEMDGYSVQWLTEMSKNSLLLLEDILSRDNPLDFFTADYTFITWNMELVHILQRHRLAHNIPWLTELEVPEIYKHVLANMFSLASDLQRDMDDFHHVISKSRTVACAQVRLGGSTDSEIFNSIDQFQSLVKFLIKFNSSEYDRIFFSSDSSDIHVLGAKYFPGKTLEMKGPITHVDRSTGKAACAGFRRAIIDQLALSACPVLVISESGLGKIAAFIRNTDNNLFLFHDGIVEKFERQYSFPNRVDW